MQIREDTMRAGTSISDINQTMAEIRQDITKGNIKSDVLDK